MIHITFMFKTHSRHIQNRLKNFWKNVLDQNIFGPKFLLDLSYDSHKIHVQNTFPTDSKQIKKILENVCGSKYFWTQIYFGP